MKPLIRTYSGLMVNPLDLSIDDIKIQDIAHHLACCNRFCGGVTSPINVAAHSLLVTRIVESFTEEPDVLLKALLHDAAEAYLGDVTKWLKQSDAMTGYRAAEESAQQIIMNRYCLSYDMPDIIEKADRIAVTFEGKRGFRDKDWPGIPDKYPPLTEQQLMVIGDWDPFLGWWSAKHEFLKTFNRLWEALGVEEDGEGD